MEKNIFEKVYDQIWEALKINPENLNEESFKHPHIALYFHGLCVLWKRRMDTLKYQLEVLEAHLRNEYRKQNPKAKPRDITKEMLDSYTTLHPDVQSLKTALIEAETIHDLLDGAVWRMRERFQAISDQRTMRGIESDQLLRWHEEGKERGII